MIKRVWIGWPVVGLAAIGGVTGCRVHVDKDSNGQEKTVQVDTPIGSMRVEGHKNLDPKLIGVPVYPGAIREEDNGGAGSWNSSRTWLPV